MLGVYIIYVTLVAYAADGLFDLRRLHLLLFAIYMFLTEHYDYFFLLVAASVFFKYEAGTSFCSLLSWGLARLLQKNPP